jgi:hypothetical protein
MHTMNMGIEGNGKKYNTLKWVHWKMSWEEREEGGKSEGV